LLTGLDPLFFTYILAMVGYFFLTWPIVAFDADLWTHLNWGRRFFEIGGVPAENFYSFISDPRQTVNYTWLFQVLIFKVFSLSGYQGLIALRTLLGLGTITLLYLHLRKNQTGMWLAVLLVFYLLVFADRSSDIRPYNFSFFFIALFLYIIEYHPRKCFILPLVAVVWFNLHGIEYPVLVLMVVAFVVEDFLTGWKEKRPLQGEKLWRSVCLVASMGAIFATPLGLKLVKVPFTGTSYASMYIDELRRLSVTEIFSFEIKALMPTYATVVHAFVLLAVFIIAVNVFQRKLRLRHLILFAGGVYLFTKGIRFVHEFALLSLPALQTRSIRQATKCPPAVSRPLAVVLAAVVVAVPLVYMNHLFGNPPRYPFAPGRLPQGVTVFLERIGQGGRILNHPSSGGYLEWRLTPTYRIYMDMHVPFFFTDADYFRIANAVSDPVVLDRLIARYQPDFISLPFAAPIHRYLQRGNSLYCPVFFDDGELLYVERRRYPAIVRQYGLLRLRPSMLDALDWYRLGDDDRRSLEGELRRLAEIYPEGRRVGRALAELHLYKKDYPAAAAVAERIIANFPDQPDGYVLKGDALQGAQSWESALAFYRQARDRSNQSSAARLYRKMGGCYIQLGQYPQAYDTLTKGIDFFSPSTDYRDLYWISYSAYRVGRLPEARMLAEFAAEKVPNEDLEWKNRIDGLIKLLKQTTGAG
jgi:hypothetical protein